MDATDRLDDIRWLVSPAAAGWLARAMAAGAPANVRLVAELRRNLSPSQAHLVVEQAILRLRGARKFAAAAQMFFTPQGLEQATDQWVAQYKADRFGAGEAVADLCCGIGGDLLALAARGPATGVDRDTRMCAMAEANWLAHAARGLPLPPEEGWGEGRQSQTSFQHRDVANCDVRVFAAWHIDPDRRPRGRRTTRVELHQPGPEVIDRLLVANGNAAIKLAPAATLPEHWPPEAELEWISRDRECRQLVCWFGRLARNPGERRATIIDSAGTMARTLVGQANVALPSATVPGEYILEPDPAVLAAGLTAALAARYGLSALAPGIGYLTGSTPVTDAAVANFRVHETLPFDKRRLREALRARGIGRLEIKHRGVPCAADQLRRELRPLGDHSATLILAPIAGRATAFLASRVHNR